VHIHVLYLNDLEGLSCANKFVTEREECVITTLGIQLQHFLTDKMVKYIFCCVDFFRSTILHILNYETLLFNVQQNLCNPEVDTLDLLIL
jgi:hypothetical protein